MSDPKFTPENLHVVDLDTGDVVLDANGPEEIAAVTLAPALAALDAFHNALAKANIELVVPKAEEAE